MIIHGVIGNKWHNSSSIFLNPWKTTIAYTHMIYSTSRNSVNNLG